MSSSMEKDIIKVSWRGGNDWDAWVSSDSVQSLRGDKSKRKRVHGENEDEAKAEALEFFAPRYPFILLTEQSNPVDVAIACIRALGESGKWKRPKTADEYASLIRNHSGKLKDKPIDAISRMEIQLLCANACSEGLSVKTAGKLRSAWSCVFEYLLEQGLVKSNPARGIRMPKQNRKTTRMLTESEYGEFCRALDDALATFPADSAGIMRRNALFGANIALHTGMRVGEVCGLQRGDIRFVDSTIRVVRSLTTNGGLHAVPPKTEAGRRTIGMDENLVNALRAHLDWQSSYMTKAQLLSDTRPICSRSGGDPFAPKAMSTAFKKFCVEEVGIALKPSESFHILRHTHASMLIASGLDIKTISARLGHSSVAITLDHYGHLMTGSEVLAASAFHEQHDKMRGAGGLR